MLSKGDIVKDQEFHAFISKFPLLEELYIASCLGLEKVMISRNRLKRLWIVECANLKAIDIDSPNSLSFTYEHNPVPYVFDKCSMSTESCFRTFMEMLMLFGYPNIKQFLRPSNNSCKLTINDLSYRIHTNFTDVSLVSVETRGRQPENIHFGLLFSTESRWFTAEYAMHMLSFD